LNEMAIKTDSSQIAALKISVENKRGHKIETRADFSILCLEIERTTNEHLSETTLRRLWGHMQGYDTVFTHTIDVLSRYLGFKHWENFCEDLTRQSGKESDLVSEGHSIDVNSLVPGDRIRIGWLPDRECIIEYLGEHRFKALECHHSTMKAGDTFECSLLILNHPLFADKFLHDGVLHDRYVMGKDHGLTTLCTSL